MARHTVAAFFLTLLSPLLLPAGIAAQGTRIGFTEDWALATDRAMALEQLIPGTRDFYYYSCRHRQDTGAFDEVEPLLRAWIQRHGRTSRVIEIENRQALMTFDKDPTTTLAFLQQRLGIRFDHERQMAGAKQDLATELDQAWISSTAYTTRALQKHPRTVAGFRESAYESLLSGDLDDDLLMDVLSRLRRPDVANLPALVVRNLSHRRSRGFGSLQVHGHLLLDQLEECTRREPSLLNQQAFVQVYLRRLLPSEDVQWKDDAVAREAHLDRLQAFVQRLASSHNSLKAHVLNHRLKHDLAAGKPDKDRLMAYLRLPRPTNYANPLFLRRHQRSGEMVDTNRSFPTELSPIGNDEPLVRAYLMHFFVDEDSFETYTDTVKSDYLRRLFAETKILHGVGDMERWYSLLNDPAYYEKLKERVEIEFAPTQRHYYRADDPVSIEVDVKHVDKLLVKVFEISTFNYYTKIDREVDASINLDGLVANHESTREFTDNPLRRIRRKFDLPQLKNPGVYVVELIGNGLSSRAVFHKGRLQYTQRLGGAGHVFSVRDEDGTTLPDASIWFGGKHYPADKDGEIVIPYSTKPGRRSLILQRGSLSTLSSFQHRAEKYSLAAGIHLDRESLLARKKARILIRPSLELNDLPVSLEILEDPVLTIRSRDRDGVESALEVRNFRLFADRESVHEIQVPGELSVISVSLRGRVKNLSQGKTVDISTAVRSFSVNEIDATPMTACPLLGRSNKGYVLDILGKNGEPKPARAVRMTLVHEDFTDPFLVTLKTDDKGRIRLGALDGIAYVQASGFPKTIGSWSLRKAARSYSAELHGIVGETLRVPYLGDRTTTSRVAVSLLELRGGHFVRDAFDHVAIAGGFIELRKLPAGDYSLWLKESQQHVTVRITAGDRQAGWAVGRDRMLETGRRAPLHITDVSARADDLRIQLVNAGEDARVHVVATRYLPSFDPFDTLRVPGLPAAAVVLVDHPESTYHSGREIGDEYRYILDRRFAKKYPGNMLKRPGLILNPWALDEDAWSTAIGMGGGAGGRFGGRGGGRRAGPASAGPSTGSWGGQSPGTFANLEFLPEPATVIFNLRPNAAGVVTVPWKDLGSGQLVHVIAVDAEETVYEELAREETPLQPRSRQLSKALDAEQHFGEQRRIEFVAKNGRAVVENVETAEAQTYDSIASIFQLFTSLSGNQDLAKFAFLLRWPDMKPEEKRKLYEEYACHELHFFIHEKDPDFFQQVIRPYLANKEHKTFLDDWLLERDLQGYLEPWAFGRLNIVERILLARRLADGSPGIQRHVRELFELQPRDPALLSRLFDSAMKSRALDEVDSLNKKLSEARQSMRKEQPAKRPGAPARSRRARNDLAPADKKAKAEGGEKAGRDRAKAVAEEVVEELEEEAPSEDAARESKNNDAGGGKDRQADLRRRQDARELYRAPDPTRPFVEHNYWHRRNVEQNADLITVNAFWRDFALAPKNQTFFSTNVAEATGNLAEMVMALAVLDLPFVAGAHKSDVEGTQLTMQAASPLLLVRKEIVRTAAATQESSILVSQNYYRLDEPYRFEGNQRFDAYVTSEFLVDVAYGCRVVVTNPTSAPRKLDLLLQIPEGAIPVQGGFYTKGVSIALDAYATSSIEYAFYFPASGSSPHYPVHVSGEGKLVAFASARSLNVVPEPSKIDTTSWQYVSQDGTDEQVLTYLDQANLQRTDLGKIAWRMQDQAMFGKVIDRLRKRHIYSDVLWSYGIRHGDADVTREYLRHQDRFLATCGMVVESPLISVDPIKRNTYQHIEYDPLFNARAHRFGKRREILNRHLGSQYTSFLRVLGQQRKLDDEDWMNVTYYLLVQDRVEEALQTFARVDADNLPMRVQHDYMRAYLDFFTDGTSVARGIAERYRDYPVLRWQKLFQDIRNQLDEVEGKAVAQSDPDSRTQRQTKLAADEPVLEVEVEARQVTVQYRNLTSCEVRYYEMDVEFLFSTHPFVQQGSGSFAFIRPNHSETRVLPEGKSELTYELPRQFLNSNVLIEVSAGGLTRRKAYYANSLAVQWIENYGQLKVTHDKTGQPLRTVYVKVFARYPGGKVKFYKDGYTDLRGRFDYTSLSAKEAGNPERFAILVLSEEHGAVIREVAPPAQ